MTDGGLVKVMARLHRLADQIVDLMDEDILEHPNGEALRGELIDNGLGYRWDCASITHSHLSRPERWGCTGGTLRWKAANGGET